MRTNKIRRILRDRRVAIGVLTELADPHVVEMIGLAGFDYVLLEREHMTMDLSQLEQLIYAADSAQIPALVRMRELSADQMGRTLDAGAMGVLLTLTETKEDALKIVAATKYPPLGHRGAHPSCRASQLLVAPGKEYKEYLEVANEETMACVLIESQHGVDNINEIASVDGIDCVVFGPVDFALDIGLPLDDWDHPKVLAARDKVIKACRDNNKALGLFIVDPAQTANLIKTGANLLIFSYDFTTLRIGLENALKKMREGAKSIGA